MVPPPGPDLPLSLSSSGLYSKVSTLDMAPSMNRKIMRLARTGRGGRLGASGFRAFNSAAEAFPAIDPRSPVRARRPKPAPAADNRLRRVVVKGLYSENPNFSMIFLLNRVTGRTEIPPCHTTTAQKPPTLPLRRYRARPFALLHPWVSRRRPHHPGSSHPSAQCRP